MAKRFRKQISRALHRRFKQYEHLLFDESFRYKTDCRKDLTLYFNEFAEKMRSEVKRIAIVACVCMLFVSLLALSSCNVTRRVTTESSFYQRGDTTCTIVTKTIESYDASKK